LLLAQESDARFTEDLFDMHQACGYEHGYILEEARNNVSESPSRSPSNAATSSAK
jgi:hypothetical protein